LYKVELPGIYKNNPGVGAVMTKRDCPARQDTLNVIFPPKPIALAERGVIINKEIKTKK